MVNKLTDMSKIRKAIKMHLNGKSKLFKSRCLSLSRNTVKKYLSLYKSQGLILEGITQMPESELEPIFSHQTEEPVSAKLHKLYEFFPYIELELKRVGITSRGMWV